MAPNPRLFLRSHTALPNTWSHDIFIRISGSRDLRAGKMKILGNVPGDWPLSALPSHHLVSGGS